MLKLRFAAVLAALALLAAPALALSAPVAPRELPLDVRMPGLAPERVVLEPFDPRAPELAAQDPLVAAGLWTGQLANGGLVRLVLADGANVALVQVGGALAWARVEAGALVPLAETLVEPAFIDSELEAPEDVPALPLPAALEYESSPRDGKVQLFLDADRSFWASFTPRVRQTQVQIVTLVDAIYRVNLGVEVEVVRQNFWTEEGPFGGSIRCDGSQDDLLRQFRDYYESTDPTTLDVREESLIFTTRPTVPHPSGGSIIGCAYLWSLENSYAYASARVYGDGTTHAAELSRNALLVAHEMGHNFGGEHYRAFPTPPAANSCYGATIMYPSLCANSPMFSDARPLDGPVQWVGLMQDGGNARHMEWFAGQRI